MVGSGNTTASFGTVKLRARLQADSSPVFAAMRYCQ